VYLKATPKGKELYLKHRFEIKRDINMNLEEYSREGEYIQSIIVWDNRAAHY